LNLKWNKRSITRLSVLVVILLISVFLLTGCVSGMQPIGWSGVAVSDGVLFAGSKEGRLISVNTNNNNALLSADPLKISAAGAGSCAGSTSSGSCGGSAPAIAIYGTPVFANVPAWGKLVYIAGYNGKVFAYDAGTLQQRWVYPVDTNLSPIVGSLTVSENVLYFGNADNNLYALGTDGTFKWKFTTGGEIWGSPTVDKGTVFVGSFDKKLYAIDAATGKEKWNFPTDANIVSTPVTFNGVVYIGSLDRNFYAIDETSGKQIWKSPGGNWFWARPVIVNGVIYAPNLDNTVYGFDTKTGNNVASWDVGGQVASWPVAINNQVVVSTRNGKLLALDTANPKSSPRLISTIVEEVTAPLASNNDLVYINGPDNNLYSYNVTTGAKFAPVSLKTQ
jgi:eukaryotic-like serine/threonine-protein kinase